MQTQTCKVLRHFYNCVMQVLLDCGAVQSDALTVDCQGSLEQVMMAGRYWFCVIP